MVTFGAKQHSPQAVQLPYSSVGVAQSNDVRPLFCPDVLSTGKHAQAVWCSLSILFQYTMVISHTCIFAYLDFARIS